MMTLAENPVDQRLLDFCCCSVAIGLAIASSVTRVTDRLIPSPEFQVSSGKDLLLPHVRAGNTKHIEYASTVGRQTKHIEYGPSKFNSCHIISHSVNFRQLHIQSPRFDKRGTFSYPRSSASTICAAAFNSTCVATQTKPLTRRQQSATISLVPHKGKSKTPSLDDGGSGLPPHGGGGGGGGGGGWSGGFFFFMFLLFLGLLKDKEKGEDYGN